MFEKGKKKSYTDCIGFYVYENLPIAGRFLYIHRKVCFE